MPFEVFISYSHRDRELLNELTKHLANLRRQQLISSWYDGDITPGTAWQPQIMEHLTTAQIILLLISADFIASDFCYSTEMTQAITRHDANQARVIPIILRPVDWQDAPFSKLQVLPTGGKPVTRWPTPDDAFEDIAKGIRAAIDDLIKQGVTPTSQAKLPLSNIPYTRNPLFTGRQDILNRLSTALHSGKTTALTQAISGLGGIGKTQTAIEYAYRYQHDYDAIFWVRAESRETLTSDFATLAHLLNLPEQHEQEQQRAIDAVKRWLQDHPRWLLILDNADDLNILRDFLPTSGQGHILLTTRSQIMGRIAQRIELEQMEPEEGILFLLRRAYILDQDAPLESASKTDQDHARQIVQAMAGLPLALDQAGAYIDETRRGLSGYLHLYRTRQADLLKHRGKYATEHEESVATTLSLSFKKVLDANPTAADLLRLCAFLDPDSIPEEIITKGAPHLGPTLQPAASDPIKLNEAITDLLTYSLIRRNPDQTLTIHRLVQAVLKHSMNKTTQRRWAERAVRAVNAAFPEVDYGNWLRCQQYIPQVQTCSTLIEQWNMTFPEATYLLMRAGRYLCDSAQYAQAEPLLLQAMTIDEQTLGFEHSDLATDLSELASLYKMQGKLEQAEPLYQRAIAIDEQALGPEHPDLATDLNNLANVYSDQGKYEQAESLYQRAIAIGEKVLGPEHPNLATRLNNLAELYREQGKFEQAEPLYQRVIEIDEKVLGSEHPNLARDLNNLALLYSHQGRYAQAEPLYQQAIEIGEKMLGPQHPYLANSLNNLAVLYYQQDKFELAESLYQHAITIDEKVLGPEHPQLATHLNNLAMLYNKQGKYTQAEPLYQRALAIFERALGTTHPSTVSVHKNYTLMVEQMKQKENPG